MKKKGLIISTVVMVVVLIAALTTTTFAWFTNSAAAEVGAIELSTQAADGLQIASVSYSAGATVLKHGDVSRLSGQYLYNQGEDDFGSSVNFATTEDSAISMFGVTGDGDKMLTASDDATGSNVNTDASFEGGKPKYLYTAQGNQYYFTADLAIQITGSVAGNQNLVFKSLSVSGTNGGRMAAAARIAFIPIDPDGAGEGATAGTGTTTAYGANPTLDMSKAVYFHPYYDYKSVAGQIQKDGTTTTPNLAYYQAESGTEYSTPSGTLSGTSYVGTATTLETAIDTWTKTNSSGDSFIAEEAGNRLNLGTYSATLQVIYLRVVIWFEGEDAECIQGSTGSGLTVSFSFDKKPAEA